MALYCRRWSTPARSSYAEHTHGGKHRLKAGQVIDVGGEHDTAGQLDEIIVGVFEAMDPEHES